MFDPNLPQENTVADAAQMRSQFNGLKALISYKCGASSCYVRHERFFLNGFYFSRWRASHPPNVTVPPNSHVVRQSNRRSRSPGVRENNAHFRFGNVWSSKPVCLVSDYENPSCRWHNVRYVSMELDKIA